MIFQKITEKNVDRRLEEHASRTEALMNEQWAKHINEIEIKLNTLRALDNK
jgi:hypothetical protein